MSTENTENSLLANLGIFGTTVEEVISTVTEEEIGGGDYAKYLELDPQKHGGEDMAIVRLIPSLLPRDENGKLPSNYARKISYKVNSDDGKTFMYDSKKSFGWRDNACPIADAHADLKKGNTATLERFRSVFNFKKPCVVLVQVLAYANHPELEGEIMPLRVYEDVEKLISKTIDPSKEDRELNDIKPNQCFDLFLGNALMLKAKLSSYGKNDDGTDRVGRTFEDSSFVKASAYKHFKLPQIDENGDFVMKTLADGETKVKVYDKVSLEESELPLYISKKYNDAIIKKLTSVAEYLQGEDTPKLEDYNYTEPSDERQEWVDTLIKAIKNNEPATLGGEVVSKEGDAKTTSENEGNVEKSENVKSEDVADVTKNDDELDDILKQAKES